jgi:hypothetical protein
MNKLVLIVIAAVLLPVDSSEAAPRSSRASGAWNAAIWAATNNCTGAAGSAATPVAADDVFICNGTTVTLDAARQVNTVTLNSGGTLDTKAFTLTIGNSPALTFNGGTLTSTDVNGGAVSLIRDGATTVAQGSAASATFSNLSLAIAYTIGGNRTYTLGGGSVTSITVDRNLNVTPVGAGGAVRNASVVMGTLTSLTVTGTTTIAMQGDNDTLSFITLNAAAASIPFTSGAIVLGGGGSTGASSVTAGSSTITLNGGTGPLFTLAAGGGFTASTSTVVMASPASVALTSGAFTGTNAFNNLTVNMAGQTGTLGAAIGVNTTLSISAGTLSDGTFAITGDGSGTFQVSNGATFQIMGATNQISNFSTVDYGTTAPCGNVNYAAAGAQTVANTAPNYGNLILSGSGAKTKASNSALTVSCDFKMQGSATMTTGNATTISVGQDFLLQNTSQFTAGAALTVTRDMTLESGTTFNAGTGTSNLTHIVQRNFANNGATFSTSGGAGPFTSTFNFNGSAAQTIGGSSSSTFNSLTINNSFATSPQVLLARDETVSGLLTLTTGRLSTGGNTLILTTAATSGSGSTSSHVIGDVKKGFDGSNLSFTYPLGDGTKYSPVTVTFASAGLTAGNLTAAAVTPSEHPDTSVAGTTPPGTVTRNGIDPQKSVNRYWTLKNATVKGTYDITVAYVAGVGGDIDTGSTQTNFRVARGEGCATSGALRTCNPWGLPGTQSNPTVTTSRALGLLISSGDRDADFAVGELITTGSRFNREKEFVYIRESY